MEEALVDLERIQREPEAMEEALADLERIQIQILEKIADLERYLLPENFSTTLSISDNSTTEGRLSALLHSNGVNDFIFKRVSSDYYDLPLEDRRDILSADSIDHLCKSIVLENTQAPADITDCSDRNNSKYYVVVVQYTARFNAETVRSFLYGLNNGKISKKKFKMRLAPEETSTKLTGYGHNAVTCIGMNTNIPVILDEAITKLNPGIFWLGGGEVDLKLGIRTFQFINFVKPFIVNCSGS